MLESDRTSHGSTALAAELRDALGRRQKELPARWLATLEDSVQMPGDDGNVDWTDDSEALLGRTVLDRELADLRPRGVICVYPSTSRATLSLVTAVSKRGDVTMVAAVERDATLARHARRFLEDNGVGRRDDAFTVASLAADCTVDLPLPIGFPRPRLFLCLGNALGTATAVAAVRMLRVFRAAMHPGDAIVLGLATAAPADGESYRDRTMDPTRHLDALARINAAFGSCLDTAHFACESRYDVEQRRSETHLVARRAHAVDIPGVCSVRFRKGDSIRTAVNCTFDRRRITAMLGGVGLSLRAWEVDDKGRTAVAVACPAT